VLTVLADKEVLLWGRTVLANKAVMIKVFIVLDKTSVI
jgi:hypothetical protein